jgi:uncharacterized paraquat-inducible protein A
MGFKRARNNGGNMKCPHCAKSIGYFNPAIRNNQKDRRCPYCRHQIIIYIEYKIFLLLALIALALLVFISPFISMPVLGATFSEAIVGALIFTPVFVLALRLKPGKNES